MSLETGLTSQQSYCFVSSPEIQCDHFCWAIHAAFTSEYKEMMKFQQ